MNLVDTEYYRDWLCKQAKAWRKQREVAREAGDFAAYDWAGRECNNYARGLPESEQAEFLE